MSKIITGICLVLLLIGSCTKPRIGTTTGNPPTGDIFIGVFYDESGDGPPTISQTMTEKLKDYFQRNARSLNIINEDNGDYKIEGLIDSYKIAPSAATKIDGIESTNLTRLTITVKASYINYVDEKEGFKDKQFSFFKDFDGSQSLSDVEEELVSEILDQIVIDIFSAAFDNW